MVNSGCRRIQVMASLDGGFRLIQLMASLIAVSSPVLLLLLAAPCGTQGTPYRSEPGRTAQLPIR